MDENQASNSEPTEPENVNEDSNVAAASETKTLTVQEWNNLQAKLRKESETRKDLEAKAKSYEQQIKEAELAKLKKEDADKYAEAVQKEIADKLAEAEAKLTAAEKITQKSVLRAAAAAHNVADIDLALLALDQQLSADPTLITDYNDPAQIEAAFVSLLEAKPVLRAPVAQKIDPAGKAPAANAGNMGFDDLANMSRDQLVTKLGSLS